MSAVSRNICAGVANIKFAVEENGKKVQPNADYDHLTVVGHSAGADHLDVFRQVASGS